MGQENGIGESGIWVIERLSGWASLPMRKGTIEQSDDHPINASTHPRITPFASPQTPYLPATPVRARMTILRYAAGTFAALVFAGYPFLALTYSTGAPAGFSGPEQNCSACHNDFPVNSGTGSLTITAPPTFTPGVPLNITVTIVNTTPPDSQSINRQGFELSTRDAANTSMLIGTYIVDGTTVQNAQGSPEFVTHTEASNVATTWSFQWMPPDSPPPQIILFAAGNAANGSGEPTGDHIYTTSLTVDRLNVAGESGPEALALRLGNVTPNPARGAATVEVTLARATHVTAHLVDATGRVVRTVVDSELAAGVTRLPVNTTDLATGAYLLRVDASGDRAIRRLTVAR